MEPETNELIFQLNDKVFSFDTGCMERNDVKSVKEDDKYAVKYIINLINNGSISLQDPLQIIYRILNNEQIIIYEADKEESGQLQSELGQVEEDVGTVGEKKRLEWGEQDTQILLEKYEIYIKLVGPMKKFKNKKVMWEKIAQDIEDNMDRKYTSIQVENRFKTLLKRKKDAIEHNKRCGNERMEVPYEEQLEQIASLDDSIKPEILMSINNTKILKNQNESSSFQPVSSSRAVKMMLEKKTVIPFLKRNIEKETKENKKKSIQETLLELHQLKEESKERYCKEKRSICNIQTEEGRNNMGNYSLDPVTGIFMSEEPSEEATEVEMTNDVRRSDPRPSEEEVVPVKRKKKDMSGFEEAMFHLHKEKVLTESERNKIEHELRLKLLEVEHIKTLELIEEKKKVEQLKLKILKIELGKKLENLNNTCDFIND